MRFILMVCVLGLLATCGPSPREAGRDILVIGDSVLAWNRTSDRDVGSAMGAALNRRVVSRAVPGARLGGGIDDQLGPWRWNWVVMDGGANDLARSCGCTDCGAALDRLISPDARSGAIPDLIARARAQGAQVLWMGYYAAPQSRSFAGCRAVLVEMERRITRHAQAMPGVHFADAEEVIDAGDRSLFAADLTHPSAEGSARIGQFLARRIAEETPR